MKFDPAPVSAGLHLVASPIGRARDITLAALDVLAGADVLAAEDTRTLRHLLQIHGVPLGGRRIEAYHDHSGPAVRDRLLRVIEEGGSLAYASEAGTPLISDPGYALLREAIGRGLPVTALPGPSALLAALAVGGLPTDRFAFAGFLPPAASARQTALAGLRDWDGTLVLYEAPGRVRELFADLCEVLGGERDGAICRELTKRHEEVLRGPLSDLAALLDRRAEDGAPLRGEVVVLVGAAGRTEVSEAEIRAALAEAMAGHRVKDAATAVAGALGVPRRQVYQIALTMRGDG